MRQGRCAAALAALVTLAGCSGLGTAPPQTTHYRCPDGKTFALSVAPGGDAATLQFEGMHFPMRPVASAGADGEQFVCDVMSVTRRDGKMSVAMESGAMFRDCIAQPAAGAR